MVFGVNGSKNSNLKLIVCGSPIKCYYLRYKVFSINRVEEVTLKGHKDGMRLENCATFIYNNGRRAVEGMETLFALDSGFFSVNCNENFKSVCT